MTDTTRLSTDADGAKAPVLYWGTTETVVCLAATANKTAARVTRDVRFVTLFSPDATTSVIRFKIDAQDTVAATDADPNPVLLPGGITVAIPETLAREATPGAGISFISSDAVTAYVVEHHGG